MSVLENPNTGPKEAILKLKCGKPVFWFGEFKVSLLIEGVGGPVEFGTCKPVKGGTGMFNETKEVVVEVDIGGGGAGSFVECQGELSVDRMAEKKFEFFACHCKGFIRENSRTEDTYDKRRNAAKGSLCIRMMLM